MICIECRHRRHKTCRRGTWCDCQHDPRRSVSGRLIDWTRVVGEEFAAVSNPLKLAGNVLVVEADDEATRWALVKSHLAVIDRVNTELGAGTVTHLKAGTIAA